MKVLILAPFYEPGTRGGGPIRTLVALVRSAPEGVTQQVFTRSHDLGESTPFDVPLDQWVPRGRASVYYATGGVMKIIQQLRQQIRREAPDVIYIQSIFEPVFALVPQLLATLWRPRLRLLVAPRGELGVGALAIKAPKKRVALAGYRLLGWDRRVLWHASSELEAADIRRVFPAVRPERIHIALDETDLAERAAPAHAAHEGPLRCVFVSRVVPKKGLDVLLQALSSVSAPISLRVVGPLEDAAYVAQCRGLAEALPSQHSVEFVGSLGHAETLAEFAAGDVFAFPTANENFGHVIAESLAMSCPVILPDVTPWSPSLPAQWVIADRSPAQWAAVMETWAGLSSEARAACSQEAVESYEAWRNSLSSAHIFSLIAT